MIPTLLAVPAAVDDDLIGPGVWGFAITFALMAVVVVLIIDMVRRVRRLRYRTEARAKIEAEEREARGDDPTE